MMNPHRSRLLAMAALCLAFPALATADISVLQKTCVDRNGGQLCENDWVDCTVRVTVSGNAEDFKVTDQIEGKLFKLWRITQAPPFNMPPYNASFLENTMMSTLQTGRYEINRVMMGPGSSYDFKYEAQVRDDQCWQVGFQSCKAPTIRNTNLQSWTGNTACITYTCAPPGPNTTLTKAWNGTASRVGDPVQFVLNLTNSGTVADTAVSVTDTVDPAKFMPPVATYTRAPNTGGLVGNTLNATWNSLGAGETVQITLDTVYANCVAAPQDGACNQGFVNSDGLRAGCAGGTPVGSDNPATTAFGDATCRVMTPGGSAMIAQPAKIMTDTNGPPLMAGDNVHVSVTIMNSAACSATGGYFEDTLPAPMVLVPGSLRVTPAGGTLTQTPPNFVSVDGFNVGGMSMVTIEFDATMSSAPTGQTCNTAQYRFGISNLLDSTQACLGRIDNISPSKRHSDPNMANTVYRGQIFDYTIDLLNNGTAAVPDASVADTIPSCFDILSIVQAGGGSPTIMGQDVTITGINLPVSATPVSIVIQVQENGTCAIDDIPCNSAVISSSGTATPIRTNDACIQLAASDLTVTKMHSDPNANGTVEPGQSFVYSIAVTNNTTVDVTGLDMSDLIPACFDVVAVLQAGGGVPTIVGQQVDITGIAVAAMAAPVELQIEVMENGSCALGDMPCNTARIDAPALPGPMDSNNACITLADACAAPPARIRPMLAAKNAPAADFSWPMEANSLEGYRVLSVLNKTLLPPIGGNLECETLMIGDVQCSDPDALTVPDRLIHYQVVGVCGGSIGAF